MSFHLKSFTSALDINRDELQELYDTARLLQPVARGERKTDILKGLVVASLFFEPSTRTRLSFESALGRLGGRYFTVTGTDMVSVSKGESYEDTARVVSGYSDLIILRTPAQDISQAFFQNATKPVINAGSGGDEHPTQALLDVFTAEQELKVRNKSLDGAHITLVGDLKYGRTAHSLMIMLRLYQNITFRVYAPAGLGLPDKIIKITEDAGHKIERIDEPNIKRAVANTDIIYATRLQKERLSDKDQIEAFSDAYRIDAGVLDTHAREDVIVMHPLPRDSRSGSNDLPIDSQDPRLAIFHQTDNGVPVRMSLICKIMGISDDDIEKSLSPFLACQTPNHSQKKKRE